LAQKKIFSCENAKLGLGLSDNQITDINPLEKLQSLEYLFLDKNKIEDINLIKNLKKLNVLVLQDNPIEVIPSFIVDLNIGIKWHETLQ